MWFMSQNVAIGRGSMTTNWSQASLVMKMPIRATWEVAIDANNTHIKKGESVMNN